MITKGQIINDRYEIIKSIGEGGMANVYLAQDKILNRKVAIKVLRGDLANDDKFIRRFQREAIAASSLSHKAVVEMYDVGEDNGTYYIVMEYVEGKTLKQLLKKRGNLTIPEVIDIMLQLTDGIAHAHDSYIIHRDLKPQNIMISDDGAIKITDFGIAMALNGTQFTQTNSVMGSVHYLPPEQASGKGSSTKSDIYSMGILMFELLTGKLPFKGDNAVEIALKHMKDPLPSVRKINPEIPQSIENIIIRATAKNPNNRYNDVREMHNDIKTCMDPKRQNEPKWEYKLPEHDPEDKGAFKEEEIKENIEQKVPEEVTKKKKKKKFSFAAAIIVLLLLVLLGGLGIVASKLMPFFFPAKMVTIPNVENLSIKDAEKALTNLGFEVKSDVKEEISKTVEKGRVIGTTPEIGRKRQEGSIITLIVSRGAYDEYKIENYVGKNYIEVQTTLEKVYKMKVVIEKKDVEITKDMNTDLIIEQDLKEGTVVTVDEDNPAKITLFIPDAYELYPNFVDEKWSIDDVQKFAEKYNLTVDVKYTVSSEPEGTIISQSRTGKIVEGTKLTITVAAKDNKPHANVDMGDSGDAPENQSTDSGENNESTDSDDNNS